MFGVLQFDENFRRSHFSPFCRIKEVNVYSMDGKIRTTGNDLQVRSRCLEFVQHVLCSVYKTVLLGYQVLES